MGGEPIAAADAPAGAGRRRPTRLPDAENLRRGLRRRQIAAPPCVAPLLVFTLLVFVAAARRHAAAERLERRARGGVAERARGDGRVADEGGNGVPREAVFAALAQDLRRT